MDKYWYAIFVEDNKGAGFVVELSDIAAAIIRECLNKMVVVCDYAWHCETTISISKPYRTRQEAEDAIADAFW